MIPYKPGPQTSEFKLTIAALIIGGVMAGAGAWLKNDTMIQMGIGLIAVAIPGYAISRGQAKRG